MEIKNNQVQCPNGHFYNAAIYKECPICSGSGTIPFGDSAGTDWIGPTGGGSGGIGKTVSVDFTDNMPGETIPLSGGGDNLWGTTRELAGEDHGPTKPADNRRANIGKTMGAFGPTEIGGEDQKAPGQTDPVVGWLVCIDGVVRGTDFRLHAGYNYIGREYGDIHIHGDMQISREKHAMIAFDSEENLYYVGPSSGRNLIKVNGKAVLNAVELHSYDVISIGTTKLMFVALCGEHFSWNKES